VNTVVDRQFGCAAGIAGLKIFETEDVFSRIKRIAQQHQTRQSSCANPPWWVISARFGTVTAIELDARDSDYSVDDLRAALVGGSPFGGTVDLVVCAANSNLPHDRSVLFSRIEL